MMRMKHATLLVYSLVVFGALTVGSPFVLLPGYCRLLLYISVHRRTLLVAMQLR